MADSERLDAYLTLHNGNYVLVMSPYVARCIRDMTGKVLGNSNHSQTRRATDLVWNSFTECREDGTPPLMEWRGRQSDPPLLFENELQPRDDLDD